MAPKHSLLEAKAKLESFCAYQERCDYEVRKKLHEWELYQEDIEALIADLISNNFLNEERFARAYCSGKFRMKRWGRIKIKQGLKQKRISDYSIAQGLSEIDPEEYEESLLKLASKKKFPGLPLDSWEYKAKMSKYLHNKGYEPSLIQSLIFGE
jgi:regulatory protein